jgi:hypothetical protein
MNCFRTLLQFFNLRRYHKLTWSQPIISGSAPSPRQDVALTADGKRIYVHAGRNNFILEDM